MALVGENGAGKSTMIKGMLGLIKTQGGVTTLNGEAIGHQAKQIAYVEQRKDIDLTFPISVQDVVTTGTYGQLGLLRNPGAKQKEAAKAALAKMELEPYTKRQIGQLSGGQLQRVFVARAIVQHADLIILDEPFVGIDLHSENKIMAMLKTWRDEGKTIVVVHHDLNKVTNYFDDLVIVNRGIVAAGPVREVYKRENIDRAFSADLATALFEDEGGQAND